MKLDTAAFQFLLFFRKYPVFGLLDLEDETTMILQNTGDYLPINMVNIPEDVCVCVCERERERGCLCLRALNTTCSVTGAVCTLLLCYVHAFSMHCVVFQFTVKIKIESVLHFK